jgi:DNA-binding transcriptional LysR family regulator
MDRLRVMEVFVRVVQSGSFSAAARDLGIGQPAISKRVAGLEDRLCVRLLARSTRRVTPTEAGVAFYERAVRALAEANEADAAAQGLGAGLEGRLRICTPVTFARLHMVPKLGEFLEAHPKLRLEVVMDDRAIDLLAENIDVAVHLGALTDSALSARKLARAERVVVASRAYLARSGTPRVPTDLHEHAAILYGQNSGGRGVVVPARSHANDGTLARIPQVHRRKGGARRCDRGARSRDLLAVDVRAGTRIGRRRTAAHEMAAAADGPLGRLRVRPADEHQGARVR